MTTKRLIIWKDVSGECRVEKGEITGFDYVYHGNRCIATYETVEPAHSFLGNYHIQEVLEPDFREDQP